MKSGEEVFLPKFISDGVEKARFPDLWPSALSVIFLKIKLESLVESMLMDQSKDLCSHKSQHSKQQVTGVLWHHISNSLYGLNQVT